MFGMKGRKNPMVLRVRTQERAGKILDECEKRGYKAIIGIEPDKPEDISDLERKLNAVPVVADQKTGRNELCPCGSFRKYKKCCSLVRS